MSMLEASASGYLCQSGRDLPVDLGITVSRTVVRAARRVNSGKKLRSD